MPSPVIRIESLSKYYRLGLIGGGTLREDISRRVAMIRGRPDPLQMVGDEDHGNRKDGQIWALKNINLEVNEGEILGIIGRNGAGKSTLLKILSKITAPTEGRIKIKGRVGSLLEVGTGFHSELTGRENIYLNGTILGMSRMEVTRKLEEIVEFAEMRQFIDTPVKRYSSGMTVRLAFAVAAHLEPEILIIDEVLAVGDATFQKKCLGKMKDVALNGRTVLFVSHNMLSIRSLCSRTLLMDGGRITAKGETEDVVSKYLALGADHSRKTELIWNDLESSPGNDLLRVTRFAIEPSLSSATPGIYFSNKEVKVTVDFVCKKDISSLGVTVRFLTWDEAVVFVSSSRDNVHLREEVTMTGSHALSCVVYPNLFNAGEYKIQIHFTDRGKVIFRLNELLSFEVIDEPREAGYYGKRAGLLAPLLSWQSCSSTQNSK